MLNRALHRERVDGKGSEIPYTGGCSNFGFRKRPQHSLSGTGTHNEEAIRSPRMVKPSSP